MGKIVRTIPKVVIDHLVGSQLQKGMDDDGVTSHIFPVKGVGGGGICVSSHVRKQGLSRINILRAPLYLGPTKPLQSYG
jgi:hypothetical protein